LKRASRRAPGDIDVIWVLWLWLAGLGAAAQCTIADQLGAGSHPRPD